MSDSIAQKRCAKCLDFFPATTEYFYADKRYKYDVSSYCKECYKVYKQTYNQAHATERHAYNVAHADEKHACDQAYAKAHTAERRIYMHDYQQAHATEICAYQQEYYQTNFTEIRAHQREHRQAHPEQYKVYSITRRARKRNAVGTHTPQDIQAQYTRQRGKCYYCHKKVGKMYHVDHVIPISKGGSNGPENLVIACPFCNLSKHDKIVRLL